MGVGAAGAEAAERSCRPRLKPRAAAVGRAWCTRLRQRSPYACKGTGRTCKHAAALGLTASQAREDVDAAGRGCRVGRRIAGVAGGLDAILLCGWVCVRLCNSVCVCRLLVALCSTLGAGQVYDASWGQTHPNAAVARLRGAGVDGVGGRSCLGAVGEAGQGARLDAEGVGGAHRKGVGAACLCVGGRAGVSGASTERPAQPRVARAVESNKIETGSTSRARRQQKQARPPHVRSLSM